MRHRQFIGLVVLCTSLVLLGGLSGCGDHRQDSSPTSTTDLESTASTTTSTAVADPVDLLVPEPDGVGPWTLGDEADMVIAGLTSILGTPNRDTGWLSSDDEESLLWGSA